MSDYLVKLLVSLEVRVEGYDSPQDAAARALEMVDEELDETSFYVTAKGTKDVRED